MTIELLVAYRRRKTYKSIVISQFPTVFASWRYSLLPTSAGTKVDGYVALFGNIKHAFL